MPLEYSLTQAYLEAARAFLYSPEVTEGDQDKVPTLDTLNALVATTYVFSFMAVEAFVDYQLERDWDSPESQLRKELPDVQAVEDLLKKQLGDVKERLKKLCASWRVPPLDEADPQLWEDFICLRDVRHFLIHPTRSRERMALLRKAGEERPWGFASGVASRILTYLYTVASHPLPDWLCRNTQFAFPHLTLLAGVPGKHGPGAA